ncbi:hypothetical protein ACIBG5_10940 [Kribbella sp. NPDC050241]|uniref:hypothetical protein n=1 Tax=Kribbella sp. NPDC050241 TaxID=3364115 RepID=UPI0037B72118
MGSKYTSAVLAASFSWNNDAIAACPPAEDHEDVAQEALEWQQLSHEGAQAESYAYPVPIRRRVTWRGLTHVIEPRQGTPPREPNRILELHGLMGAIGEQVGLAWTAEQDVQRLSQTRAGREPIHHRLVARAQAELAGHFVLGAAHSLGNLAVRVITLNAVAAAIVERKYSRAGGFPPGSDSRDAWPTLNSGLLSTLRRAADAAQNRGIHKVVCALAELHAGEPFDALDGRRGMDYHRRRPQSLPHASPRGGTVHGQNGLTTISVVAPSLEVEADEDLVHQVVVAAMRSVSSCMFDIRAALPAAVREEGINYPYGP